MSIDTHLTDHNTKNTILFILCQNTDIGVAVCSIHGIQWNLL